MAASELVRVSSDIFGDTRVDKGKAIGGALEKGDKGMIVVKTNDNMLAFAAYSQRSNLK